MTPEVPIHVASDRQGSAREGAGPLFLEVAVVRTPHGLRGAFRAAVVTDFPQRLQAGSTIWVGEPPTPRVVESSSISGGTVLLKVSGVDDRDAADALRGTRVVIPAGDTHAAGPDAFYWHELVGLEVWTDSGETLGPLVEVIRAPANDILVVNTSKGELWLPAIREVLLDVDRASGTVRVHILDGLR